MKNKFLFMYALLILNLNKVSALTLDGATDCKKLVGAEIVEFITDLFNMVKWIALALGLVLGMLDFFKAVAASDDGALKKSATKFVKRLIGIVILFILPILLEYILDISGVSHGGTCLNG